MTDEQIAKKKKYAGEKQTSMKRRDDHHDYTERRIYMITIEVDGRRPVFGTLVGDPLAPDGSGKEPRIELSELGKAVQNEWMGIHGYFPQIDVLGVQMMPDHMHGILFVKAPLPMHAKQKKRSKPKPWPRQSRCLRKKAPIPPFLRSQHPPVLHSQSPPVLRRLRLRRMPLQPHIAPFSPKAITT